MNMDRRPRRSTTGLRRGRGNVESSLSSSYDAVFVHRKNALYRRAAELSAITDCEISIIVFSPDGELSQFTTSPMKKMLKQYSKVCMEPHECHDMESIQEKLIVSNAKKHQSGSMEEKKRNRKSGAGNKGRAGNSNAAAAANANTRRKQKPAKAAEKDLIDEEGLETVEAILSMRNVAPLDAPEKELKMEEGTEGNRQSGESAMHAENAFPVGGKRRKSSTDEESRADVVHKVDVAGEMMNALAAMVGGVEHSHENKRRRSNSSLTQSEGTGTASASPKEQEVTAPLVDGRQQLADSSVCGRSGQQDAQANAGGMDDVIEEEEEEKTPTGGENCESPVEIGIQNENYKKSMDVGTPLKAKQVPAPPSLESVPLLGPPKNSASAAMSVRANRAASRG